MTPYYEPAKRGAIIAGNPRNATQALEAFWGELAIVSPKIPLPPPFMWGEKAALAMAILAFGVPNFFKPRWMPPYDLTDAPANWTSFYEDEIAKIKQQPGYIQLMGDAAPSSIVRLVRPAHEEEQAARDYDFSESAIQGHQAEGYTVARAALGRT